MFFSGRRRSHLFRLGKGGSKGAFFCFSSHFCHVLIRNKFFKTWYSNCFNIKVDKPHALKNLYRSTSSNRQNLVLQLKLFLIEIVFQVRTQESKGLPPQISTEDFLPRFKEFRRFEDSFADCLSKTAVKTKFAQHAIRGEQVK